MEHSPNSYSENMSSGKPPFLKNHSEILEKIDHLLHPKNPLKTDKTALFLQKLLLRTLTWLINIFLRIYKCAGSIFQTQKFKKITENLDQIGKVSCIHS